MTQPRGRPLLLVPLLAAALLFVLFSVKAVDAERRIWLPATLGPPIPIAGPVNSAPFSVQLHRALERSGRLAARAQREQTQQIIGLRRLVAAQCSQHVTLMVADGRGGERPMDPKSAADLCRSAHRHHWGGAAMWRDYGPIHG
jgi:hypothetical protein